MLTIGDFARLCQVSPRMLRHYDAIGLLRPSRVDPVTGYRYYTAGQFARLHRIVALRDLGFTLDQIAPMLDGDLTVGELKAMLTMRRAQIEAAVSDQQQQLQRVEARLRTLEGRDAMTVHEVVVKHTQPVRIAQSVGTADGYGNENLGPVFAELVPKVYGELCRRKVRPGICIAHYEEYVEGSPYVVHVGFDIGDQDVAEAGDMHVVVLPPARVASIVHHGPMADIVETYAVLALWIEDSGNRMTGRSRELYHEWHDDDPVRNVTEVQLLLTD